MAKKIHRPIMPKETQKEVAWLVKGYQRYVQLRYAIMNASPRAPEVPGRSGKISDPVGQTVARLEHVSSKIAAIEAARSSIPPEYRQGVWDYCVMGRDYPEYGNIKTWNAYRNDFLYIVAADLGMPLERD